MKFKLTLSQQKAVRWVVGEMKNDPDPLFFWGYTPNRITLPESQLVSPFDVPASDMHAIEGAGLIEQGSTSTGGSRSAGLLPAAFAAVADNFGHRKRDTVLRAIYELSGGDPDTTVSEPKIIEASGLTAKEVSLATGLLIKQGLAQLYWDGWIKYVDDPPPSNPGPTQYQITAEGVGAVEDPDEPAGRNVTNYHGPVATVNAGPGSTVTQHFGSPLGEVVEAVLALRAELAAAEDIEEADRKEADEQLENAQQEAASPKPKASRLRAFLGAALSSVSTAAGAANNLLNVAEKCGLHLRH